MLATITSIAPFNKTNDLLQMDNVDQLNEITVC